MSAPRDRTRPLALVLGAAAGLCAALIALRRLDAVEVTGRSMAPGLLPGDRLLVESHTYRRRGPRRGEVVLAPDPRDRNRELIKRVAAVDRSGLRLRGDDPAASTDSRTFGSVPTAGVRWRALLRYWPPSRIGPVPSAATPVEALGGEAACAAFGELVLAFDDD
jgi:nickel-type superoxide dismutase maturation protease